MENNGLKKSFNDVMNNTFFTRNGVLVEKLIGGFRVFNHKVKTMEEVDNIINQTSHTIRRSIKKG